MWKGSWRDKRGSEEKRERPWAVKAKGIETIARICSRGEKLGKASYLGLTLSFMGLIFYFSHEPRPFNLQLPGGWDKILHTLEYSILGYLLAKTLRSFEVRKIALLGWMIGSLYGLSDEIHQYFVPGREASVMDLFFDSIGTLIGTIIALNLRKIEKYRKDTAITIPDHSGGVR
jgi:VanZ family protein